MVVGRAAGSLPVDYDPEESILGGVSTVGTEQRF
jgi:hypothetical protein